MNGNILRPPKPNYFSLFSLLYRKILRIVRIVEKKGYTNAALIIWVEFLPPTIILRNDNESISSIARRAFECGDKRRDVSLAFNFLKDSEKQIFSINMLSILSELDLSSNMSLKNTLCVMSSILRSSGTVDIDELHDGINYYNNFFVQLMNSVASDIIAKTEYSDKNSGEMEKTLQHITRVTRFKNNESDAFSNTLVSVAESSSASESILNLIMHSILSELHIKSNIILDNNELILQINHKKSKAIFFSWSTGVLKGHLQRQCSSKPLSMKEIYMLLIQKQLGHQNLLTDFQLSICKQQVIYLLSLPY